MGPVVARHKIDIIDRGGIKGGHHGLKSRTRDGPGRQSMDDISVIRRYFSQVASLDLAFEILHAVDGSGIALELHPLLHPVVKNG